ncbi:hypothetical protein ElyMa_004119600 [Elysia marginata]|uniref:Uncharacterized protein n=1 Tax=Elysia marginata TaxID=1093978 RepID=A0AAV4GFU6_9GAST|nr:hypothetical protein ElyMa_004119600 [Elysia marginata]
MQAPSVGLPLCSRELALRRFCRGRGDAIHSLSVPKTNNTAESDALEDHESLTYSLATYPPVYGSLDAASIPEYLRGGSIQNPGRESVQSSTTRPSSHATSTSGVSHPPTKTLARSCSYNLTNSQGHRPQVKCSPYQTQLWLDNKSLSSTLMPTTATTRQPEPLGTLSCRPHPFQSVHKRLSRSSPSLSPIFHEDDGRYSPDAADSCVEDSDALPFPCDISDDELMRFRTVNTRLLSEEHIKPLPISVSTPCLVHMHKILPSCIKKLNCPSSSFSTEHAHSYKDSLESVTHIGTFSSNSLFYEEKVEGKNLQPLNSSGSPKHSSPSMGSKRPGKVVMMISKPHACQEAENFLEENQPHGLTSPDSLKLESTAVQLGLLQSDNNVTKLELRDNTDRFSKEYSKQSLEHDSPGKQGRHLLQTAKPCLKIERQIQQTHWRVLAPLARVLTFAYSQVVNAMALLEKDESSVSSENNLSRASSFSKEISASHSSSPSKNFPRANLDTLQPMPNGHHKRQMSQVSLAGSVFSSDSFEVLDVSEMESSNFFYVGADSNDILQEYHLFPSKPSLFTQSTQAESTASASHSGAIIAASFPIHSLGAVDGNLMSSSSADFAHFDFRELISNRQDNKLNPPSEICNLQNEAVDIANSALLQSFIVVEGNRSSGMDSKSNWDDIGLPFSQEGQEDLNLKNEFDHESQSSFSILSESEFEARA